MSSGAQVDMNPDQMLSYTVVSALLADMLVVKTPASGWLSEGVLLKLYGRPLSVLSQLFAQTASFSITWREPDTRIATFLSSIIRFSSDVEPAF